MEEQMNKVILLDKMAAGYDELEKLLGPLNEARMTTAGVNGAWSIKDILAHLASWQRRALDRLHAAARNEKPRLPRIANDEEMDALNEQFYQENKARPLAEVLADFRSSHLEMLEAVQALSNESLTDPQRFDWLEGTALWELVVGNSYGHIADHMEPIREWLSRTR